MRRLYNIIANRFNVYPGKIHRPVFSWGATAFQRYRRILGAIMIDYDSFVDLQRR